MLKHPYLFIDLDGTLLTKNQTISKYNLEALDKYTKANGTVVLSTGRSLANTLKVVSLIKNKINYQIQYISCFNGALIYDCINHKVLSAKLIDSEILTKLFDFTKTNNLGFWPYNQTYIDEMTIQLFNISYAWLIKLYYTSHIVIKPKQYDPINDKVYKVNILPNALYKKLNSSIYQQLKELCNNQATVSYTSKHIIEITPQKTDKGEAMKFIAKLLNTSLDQIACIGDSSNDIPMFKIANLSAAAKLKRIHIKDYVDLIINKKKHKDSVGIFINQYLLNNH
ncbi:Cof-type HAD-IIB family hydrolase [Ureaplasma diversum]|uniref:Uncharacterized protein n=1 Tax=Ureaplasma diversum NCTC 246 TaxID=1188241 RepID=A0A084EWI5_9BACT|nr:Cof-type HAD-IIB family hydrolase [Ureaplasma diversum]KEZ22327.1 Hypothetical protein, predicted hydrolase of the HAD family [Ureaplasma diversum NCTC 246]